MSGKIILLELNEVPYKVIDRYLAERKGSFLAKVLPRMSQYTCRCEDGVQLDPWISWPTLHRGVSDVEHGIYHLGQSVEDIDKEYPPLWRVLKSGGKTVGVFGSLTSSATPADVRDYSFYVPDYFADEVFAHPASLLPFQELNLALTRKSARNVSRALPSRLALRFLASALPLGVTFNTIFNLGKQLLGELRDPVLRVRRRSLQPLLMADLFIKQLDSKRPDFASFYTNHVAAAMHRYWAALFPEDYIGDNKMPDEWVERYKDEILVAMDYFDLILKKFVDFVDANPEYRLVITSSLGQDAIPAEKTQEFLTITNLDKFISALGLSKNEVVVRPAMVPCSTVIVAREKIEVVRSTLAGLSINDTSMLESVKPSAPLSYDLQADGTLHLFIQWNDYKGPATVDMNGQARAFSDLGLGMMAHEDGVNCTAQHVRDGSLLIYGKGVVANSARLPVGSTAVAPSILSYLGVPVPAYMRADRGLLA